MSLKTQKYAFIVIAIIGVLVACHGLLSLGTGNAMELNAFSNPANWRYDIYVTTSLETYSDGSPFTVYHATIVGTWVGQGSLSTGNTITVQSFTGNTADLATQKAQNYLINNLGATSPVPVSNTSPPPTSGSNPIAQANTVAFVEVVIGILATIVSVHMYRKI